MSGAWRDQLRPASWRGVPFAVLGSESQAGRRVQLHEYPFRDEPWAEDLGRRARTILVKGFLVGDDVAAQLEAMEAAAEEPGAGELIHPSRGARTATLVTFSAADAWDQGRVVTLNMEFVETGERRFPQSVTDTAAAVLERCGAADLAAAGDYEAGVLARIKEGYAVTQAAVRAAQGYAATAQRLANSATGAVRAVAALGGFNLGRFAGSGRLLGHATLPAGVSAALGGLSRARAAVSGLAAQVTSLAGRL